MATPLEAIGHGRENVSGTRCETCRDVETEALLPGDPSPDALPMWTLLENNLARQSEESEQSEQSEHQNIGICSASLCIVAQTPQFQHTPSLASLVPAHRCPPWWHKNPPTRELVSTHGARDTSGIERHRVTRSESSPGSDSTRLGFRQNPEPRIQISRIQNPAAA